MSTVKKQVGDQVMITAGQFKNRAGKLIVKNRGGWTVELEDGQQVSASFAMVALIPATDGQETTEEPQAESTVEDSSTEENASSGEPDLSSQVDEQQNETQEEGNQPDIAKMTVKQLQALAKQRGIGIARTKPDFLRIIKEKNPDEDLDQLVGKVLFDRVTELHVSRLRTKDDLVQLLKS